MPVARQKRVCLHTGTALLPVLGPRSHRHTKLQLQPLALHPMGGSPWFPAGRPSLSPRVFLLFFSLFINHKS